MVGTQYIIHDTTGEVQPLPEGTWRLDAAGLPNESGEVHDEGALLEYTVVHEEGSCFVQEGTNRVRLQELFRAHEELLPKFGSSSPLGCARGGGRAKPAAPVTPSVSGRTAWGGRGPSSLGCA